MTENKWHIEKRIDLSMILSAAIVVGGGFWWASDVNSKFAAGLTKIESVEKDIQETRNYVFKVEERLQR